MAITDGLSTISTLLSSNWTANNTNSRTPSFNIMKDSPKRGQWRFSDQIYLYPGRTITQVNGIGKSSRRILETITIDIRTAFIQSGSSTPSSHALKMVQEVDRIIKGNRINPDANYNILLETGYYDLSDAFTKMGKYVYDVTLEKLNDTW